MSYDALVWLLVGLGIGVAASLMLLIGYSMLEYGRLSRRFRKARVAATAADVPVTAALPVAPRTSLLARPSTKPAVAAKPTAEAVIEVKPTVETKPTTEPKPPADEKPARSALAIVREPKAPAIAKPAPSAPVVEAKPAVVSASEALTAPLPKRAQSVEAMFAEAFAHDRLTASPEPDETAAAKPGVEKPPA